MTSKIEYLVAILTLIGVIFAALQYMDSHSRPEIKESSVTNNNEVIYSQNSPKESTTLPSEPEVISQDLNQKSVATIAEQNPDENPSTFDGNTEERSEQKPSISSSQATQPIMSQAVTDNIETGGIGEYVSGRGYRMTNEYEKDSLPPNCAERSVVAYCISSDSCVDCDGKCWLPGVYTSINDVTSICSAGTWRIT